MLDFEIERITENQNRFKTHNMPTQNQSGATRQRPLP